jgi:hypothetical protein
MKKEKLIPNKLGGDPLHLNSNKINKGKEYSPKSHFKIINANQPKM